MANIISSTSEALSTFGAHTVRHLPGIFRDERQPVSYDMLFRDSNDGCARYDDVWGG
jgi:hypothetical protein